MRHHLPYRLLGGTRFYQRREIKDVLSYLRLISAKNDWVDFERVINVPPRGLGDVSLGHLRQMADRQGVGPYDALVLLRDTELDSGLTGRARRALLDFLATWESLLQLSETATVADLIDAIGSQWGYVTYLLSTGPEAEDRLANVQELRGAAAEHFAPGREELARFLDEVALVADVDELEDQVDAPVLLTLHTAKGLEFPVVFIVGMQEGVLPHSRSLEDPDELEEERRLCYVGMTRAMRRLYLLHAASSRMYGQSEAAIPSRFLKEIPPEITSDGNRRTPVIQRSGRPSEAARRSGAETAGNAAPEPKVFAAGDTVLHPTFGRGTVVEYKETKDDAELTVAFEGRGMKRLLASLAPLTRA